MVSYRTGAVLSAILTCLLLLVLVACNRSGASDTSTTSETPTTTEGSEVYLTETTHPTGNSVIVIAPASPPTNSTTGTDQGSCGIPGVTCTIAPTTTATPPPS